MSKGFGQQIAAAYAAEGPADRPRARRPQGQARSRGGRADPAAHDEPPRPGGGRDRHRQDGDAADDRRAALGRGRGGVRRRREGRRLRGGRRRRAGRSRREAHDRAGPGVRAGGVPGRVPLARRARVGGAGARHGHGLRPAAAGEDAQGQPDPGAEPRARLPLRRREGPAAARPVRPARAAHLPGLGRRARTSSRASAGWRRRRSACCCAHSWASRTGAAASSSASRSSTSPICCAPPPTAAA